MDCLRIKLFQKKAHYRKEESITNKMTYPLPPVSTVIGALHAACSYTEYHPMDLSIQGKYGSMQREVYRDHAILNSVMDDRGILVKIPNGNFYNEAYHVVATALKSQGNSFRKNETISIQDMEDYHEYCELLNKRDELAEEKKVSIDPQITILKKEKNELKKEQKNLDKKSEDFLNLANKIKEIDAEINKINSDYKERKLLEYERPYSQFKSLTTSIRSYEVLNDVELVLHIHADENVLADIEKNINNFVSLGRSEDFVEIINVSRLKLEKSTESLIDSMGERGINHLSAFIPMELIKNEEVDILMDDKSNFNLGTRYWLNKEYTVENNQRIFNKIPVLFTEDYGVDDESENIYIDVEGRYYVAFL